jgi:uncharacterized protein YqjF (DUF2071 family)
MSEGVLKRAPLVGRVASQGLSLDVTGHRPWAPPDDPWLMAQTWEDLLFAHWPVEASLLRRVVPQEIPIDTFDGAAWIAVTPFEVRALRLQGLLPPPVVSRFPEVNVRTYATIGGRPGIWFFSLDAGSRLAVAAARRFYRLPYFHARMALARSGGRVSYDSRRADGSGLPAELAAEYGPTGAAFEPQPGSLEHFLTERYCLYTLDERRRVLRAEIHHRPWSIQPASAELSSNTMTRPLGLELSASQPWLHFAARQDVVIWPPSVAA